jgi:LysR family transcriptional regulator, glycine cleavage system transcriptional activator
MRRALPPLNAMHAFEAAARQLSFTRAAAELHVTQAAVSHQVKALEEHLGVKLFRRLPRRLLLTDEGQSYARALGDAFSRLAEATARLHARDARRLLTVSVIPSFAARWLVPRLGRFRELHPDIDVRVAPTAALADFARDDVDVGIRFGPARRFPGLRVDLVLGDEMFPVCSPRLRRGPRALRDPDDLRHHTLLHDEGHEQWRAWLAAAGLRGLDAGRGPIFTDASMLLQAAAEGQGVAIARRVLAEDELHRGRLVRPFPLALPTERAYWLVSPRATAEQPKIRAFRDWLLAEAGRR